MALNMTPDTPANMRNNLLHQAQFATFTAASIGPSGFHEVVWNLRFDSKAWNYAQMEAAVGSVLQLTSALGGAQGHPINDDDKLWVILKIRDKGYVSTTFPTAAQYAFIFVWNLINGDYNEIFDQIIIRWLNPPPAGGAIRGLGSPTLIIKGPGRHSFITNYEYGPDDFCCCQRALYLLETYHLYHRYPSGEIPAEVRSRWTLLRKPADNPDSKVALTLQTEALKLSREAEVRSDQPVSFDQLYKFAEVLSRRMDAECHIQVFSGEFNMELVFSTKEEGVIDENFDAIIWFDLVLQDEHYTPVTKIHRLLSNQKKFCYRCKKTFHKKHKCITACSMCDHPNDHYKDWKQNPVPADWTVCDGCNRSFYGVECFNTHIPDCKLRWKCAKCNKTFSTEGKASRRVCTREEHKCDDMWCFNCMGWKTTDHRCYMQPKEKKPIPKGTPKYLFCDFEATQNTGCHVINLAVTQSSKGMEWIHQDIEEWVEFILDERWQGFTVVFHNGKGYDFHFIMRQLMQLDGLRKCINPIMQGAKILYFTVAAKKVFNPKTGLRFVDSVNFLPMRLTKFTKTFGLTTKKGYYPHFFNTFQNRYYKGPMPNEEAFGVHQMTDKDYKTFKEWYDERSLQVWDNNFELVDYCRADVDLLREGCLLFRKLVIEAVGHDPFQEITLASSAMAIFKENFLPVNCVAALPVSMVKELRPALSGGRTGATKLFYKADEATEKLYYVDFTSSYPWVCKNGVYPMGFPSIWREGDPYEDLPDIDEGMCVLFFFIFTSLSFFQASLFGLWIFNPLRTCTTLFSTVKIRPRGYYSSTCVSRKTKATRPLNCAWQYSWATRFSIFTRSSTGSTQSRAYSKITSIPS